MGKPVHAPVFLTLTRGPSGTDGKEERHVPEAWTVWTQVRVACPVRRGHVGHRGARLVELSGADMLLWAGARPRARHTTQRVGKASVSQSDRLPSDEASPSKGSERLG